MSNTPADILSQGEGEIFRAWLNNLGIAAPSMGKGELMSSLANAAATSGSQGRGVQPSNTIAASLPRTQVTSAAIAPASGTLQMVGVYLIKGQLISNVNWQTGSTAGATLNHQWAGLYTPARVLVAVSADGTSTAIGANSTITFALATPYTVPTSGLYYVGVLVTNNSGTQPTSAGLSLGNANTSKIVPILGGTSNTGLSTPQALGTTATAITGTADLIYVYLT